MNNSTQQQSIQMFHTQTGTALSNLGYHENFLGQRIGSIQSLRFHPYKNILAAGGTDHVVSLFG